MRKAGYTVLVYLDDFCGVEPTLKKAKAAYAAFLALALDLGLDLAHSKCLPPTHALEWLGFHVDASTMTVAVPDTKLHEILDDCKVWSKKSHATKKDFQSLAGRLVHISRCIRPARRFICRILSALRAAPDSGQVAVSVSVRADVKWFALYAERSNGIHLIDPDLQELIFTCDSSLRAGGGHSSTHYYTLPYTAQHCKKYTNSTQLEAVNLVVAYRTLLPRCTAGMKVVIYTDNMSSASALSTGRTRDSALAACSRQLWLEAALQDHTVEIRHKPGSEIPLADALSRFYDKKKRQQALKMVAEQGLRPLPPAQPHPFFTKI